MTVENEGGRLNRERTPRLFGNPILESLSLGHPLAVLALWLPISLAMVAIGAAYSAGSVAATTMVFLFGLFVWTGFEYVMHRYLFHLNGGHPVIKRLVFVMHGIHHASPQDPSRSVMPPAAALLIASVLYVALCLVTDFGARDIAFGGFLFGYVCYDLTHHACHHWPMKGRLLATLKRNHLLHHNIDGTANFGVSSPLWDMIFGSKIDLKRQS